MENITDAMRMMNNNTNQKSAFYLNWKFRLFFFLWEAFKMLKLIEVAEINIGKSQNFQWENE